jgi:hypothetical protein
MEEQRWVLVCDGLRVFTGTVSSDPDADNGYTFGIHTNGICSTAFFSRHSERDVFPITAENIAAIRERITNCMTHSLAVLDAMQKVVA